MIRILATFLLTLLLSLPLSAVELEFYLPKEDYNSSIPTPESVLGYQVGDWHVRHDQLVLFYKKLAASSDRVTVKTIGYSHEQRELLHLVITSPENQARISDIKNQHIKRLTKSKQPNSDEYPLVVNLNYSVHGDESSGSNASMLVAYYLAASNDPAVKQYLDNMVIIIDPSLNPDGLSRFAQWANQHKGKNLNSDPLNREHVQDWIRGRVNHYWFDLNRDWLLLQHPESRARINEYHQWRPNVLTDHHEMGTHSTFFFQPGIPSRKNPYTPEQNVELTGLLAKYHAEEFDQQNKLYFTEEGFDDFYAGKGSTYPDLHGTIGILFEQGSSRGHLQESINGDVDFPTTIKHQVMVSFSTLKGSLENKNKLLDFQWQFSQQYKKLSKELEFEGVIVSESKDRSRFRSLVALLASHQIEMYALDKDAKIDGKVFSAKDSIFIPMAQPQIRLIQSMFSELTSFKDNTFYDVSSWNLGMAFNIDYAKVTSAKKVKLAKAPLTELPANLNESGLTEAYSYAIDWADYQAPAMVYQLLDRNIKLRAALKPFSAKTDQGVKQFAAGTMLIHAGLQSPDWLSTVQQVVNSFDVPVTPILSGLTPNGIDLGSRLMLPVSKPEVLIVGGLGTNPYEVGETWYLFDQQLGFSPTIVEKHRMARADLSRYSHIMLMDGSYNDDDKLLSQLKDWVKAGGVLWGQKRAALWLSEQKLLATDNVTSADINKLFDKSDLAYGEQEAMAGRQRIAGAFFETKLDLSHPLAFGFSDTSLPIFKNRTGLLLDAQKPYTNVAVYTEMPLLAGYADNVNVQKIAGATAMAASKLGSGVVIGMTDDPNFRSIMYGTNRLVFNALFLADALK